MATLCRSILLVALLPLACGGGSTLDPTSFGPLEVVEGDAQTLPAGGSVRVGIRARDRNGRLAAGVPIDFTVTSGGGSVFPKSAATDADGVASTTWSMGTAAGVSQKLAASVAGNLTTTLSATVVPGAAASLTIMSPATAELLVGDELQLSAVLRDKYGNTTAGATPVWASSDPTAVTVDSAGVARGVGIGSSMIHASAGTIEGFKPMPVNGVRSGNGTASIDGTLLAAEWAGATSLAVPVQIPDGTTAGRLYVMNDATDLYIAFTYARPGVVGERTSLAFEFDSNFDGHLSAGDDGFILNPEIGFLDLVRYTGGACPVSALCSGADTEHGGTSDGAAAYQFDGTTAVYEFRHPLDSHDPHDFALTHGSQIRTNLSLRLLQQGGAYEDTDYPGPAGTAWFTITIR